MSNEEFGGVARIDRRLQERRRQVRERLESVPQLFDLAHEARSIFSARLTYLRIGDWETGNRAAFEARGLPMSPPQPKDLSRRRRK